jgi:purine-nucleoside phosphorylase
VTDGVADAAAVVAGAVALRPEVAVVLGSGLGGFADELEGAVALPYGEIPGWPVATAAGHAGTLVAGTLDGLPLWVLRGRAHLYEGHPAAKVVFGVRVLGRLGVRTLVLTNAAGGIDPAYGQGALVLISDHVNLQGASPLVGPNDDMLGPRFPDLTDAYDPELRRRARAAAERLGIELHEGVYAAWLGPAYETPAEIRFVRAHRARTSWPWRAARSTTRPPRPRRERACGARPLSTSSSSATPALQPERSSASSGSPSRRGTWTCTLPRCELARISRSSAARSSAPPRCTRPARRWSAPRRSRYARAWSVSATEHAAIG